MPGAGDQRELVRPDRHHRDALEVAPLDVRVGVDVNVSDGQAQLAPQDALLQDGLQRPLGVVAQVAAVAPVEGEGGEGGGSGPWWTGRILCRAA